MTKFQDKSFSVHAGTGQQYRDNWDATFGSGCRCPEDALEPMCGQCTTPAEDSLSDLVRRATALMRATNRGEVQAHIKDGDGWAVLTLPEHRPAPEGPHECQGCSNCLDLEQQLDTAMADLAAARRDIETWKDIVQGLRDRLTGHR